MTIFSLRGYLVFMNPFSPNALILYSTHPYRLHNYLPPFTHQRSFIIQMNQAFYLTRKHSLKYHTKKKITYKIENSASFQIICHSIPKLLTLNMFVQCNAGC